VKKPTVSVEASVKTSVKKEKVSAQTSVKGEIVSVKTPETSVETPEITVKVSEQIIQLAKEKPTLTMLEMSQIIGVTKRSIERSIQGLRKKGFLHRVGPTKTGHWEVTEKYEP
jgi:ATP-dependent DNA helicase RecG